MFSGLFLQNTRVRGRLKIAYYMGASLLKGRLPTVRRGICCVCGVRSAFFYYLVGFDQYGVDPSDETGFCWHCGSQNRNRALARALMTNFFSNESGSITTSPLPQDRNIYLAAANGALFDALRKNKQLLFSEYFDGVEPGTYRNTVQCQDLTRLTYENESIDVVISEHVMEHVNDPCKAFSEISRVLKPGGLLLFSIPFEGEHHSVVRITPDMHELEPRKYHKDPLRNQGALVFSDFSRNDFVERFLDPTGLHGEIVDISSIENVISPSTVVIARKPS